MFDHATPTSSRDEPSDAEAERLDERAHRVENLLDELRASAGPTTWHGHRDDHATQASLLRSPLEVE
jgi:hypothetical protein